MSSEDPMVRESIKPCEIKVLTESSLIDPKCLETRDSQGKGDEVAQYRIEGWLRPTFFDHCSPTVEV